MITGTGGFDLANILTTFVANTIVRIHGGKMPENDALKGRSITDAANASALVIPFFGTRDIPRDKLLEAAKNAELKIAWDIKRFVSLLIADTDNESQGASAVSFDALMKKIPITILSRDEDSDMAKTLNTKMNINVVSPDKVGEALDLSDKIERESIEYALSGRRDIKLIAEVDMKTGIVTDRASIPTQVILKLKYFTENAGVKEVEYIISVHAVVREVEEEELLSRILNVDSKKFWRDLVRMEKGEISFISGLLLQMKNLHRLAKSKAKRGAGDIFDTIDRFNLLQNLGVNVYPFTTLMVSDEFVASLKKNGMDIYEDVGDVLKSILGLGVFIYNQNDDTVEVYYDGDKSFSTYTFDEMSKDTAKLDKQIREFVKFNVK